MMKIIGVGRATKYSPNHVENDAAILEAVAGELRMAECHVALVSEEEFVDSRLALPDVVFSMSRSDASLQKLEALQKLGVRVVNPPQGIRNCRRETMTRALLNGSVPHPCSWFVSTKSPQLDGITFPCWVKRGDSHAMLAQDVSYAVDETDVLRVCTGLKSRGIETAVVNEHLEGDLVKFYGVADTGFFHWFYPSQQNYSKFGLEKVNGATNEYRFDVQSLESIALLASKVLGVPLFGGDAVVSSDGLVRIIDFNDFPAFTCCRVEAAKAIARYVCKME